ncbi:MAG: hypothetical protein ACOCWQ_01400 [Nanoarchaeota archaeon]
MIWQYWRRKAQVTTEFTTLVALLLVIAMSVITVVASSPQQMFKTQARADNLLWYNAPVGIRQLTFNGSHAHLYLMNNGRIKMEVQEIWLDGQRFDVADMLIQPGQINAFTVAVEEVDPEVSVIIAVNSSYLEVNQSLRDVPYHVQYI